ncbi:helix-turn-helix domain-containing protein [Conexibacter sp. DBS9H8]|uniref:winged helix-turn-helix transcriptional regulator n=1 Tax=Conexibacter sp. DBS9H8 TaxID=2937801 RepID=UPI00200F8E36|nr:helix-turn-helix domain-containing protein [Conexibacter sp. DBS9H8]
MPHVPSPKRHPYAQWSPDARALDIVGDKWTLLIVRDLAAGPRRFVELQRVLPGISTEQLRSRLNRMVADGILTRQRYREVPPRVDYELTPRARDLLPVLGALARWGYEWAWSAPRTGERVDVGAIFRLAAGLLSGADEPTAVELTVTDADPEGQPLTYTVLLGRNGAEVQARPGDLPAATASATTAGWIRALTRQDLGGVRVDGDAQLAHRVIAELGQEEIQLAARDRGAGTEPETGAGEARAA